MSARLKGHRQTDKVSIFSCDDQPAIDQTELFDLIARVQIAPGFLTIELDGDRVRRLLGQLDNLGPEALQITLPFTERRRGVEMKLIIGNLPTIDVTLLANIAKANHWYARLKEGATYNQLSEETGTSKRRIQHMIHLAFLAPDIVRQITQGTQPIGLTSDWLLRHPIPIDWDAQRQRIANL